MADALSRKAYHSLNTIVITQLILLTELEDFSVQLVSSEWTYFQVTELPFMLAIGPYLYSSL